MSNPRRLIEAVEVTEGGVHIVRLMQIFDAASVSEFEKVLAYLMARGHFKLVVDLTKVEFVASAGWGALTAEFRRVRDNGGDIRLAGMNPDVLDVFFLLELDSFMSTYETQDAALASFEIEQSPAPLPMAEPQHAPTFGSMRSEEAAIVEAEDDAPQEPGLQASFAKKEARKKRGHRAAAPMMSDTTVDSRGIYEVTASFDPAMGSATTRGPEHTTSSKGHGAKTAPPEASPLPVETENATREDEDEDATASAEEEEFEARNNARETPPELNLGEPKRAPAGKKSHAKNRAQKEKPRNRFPVKPAPAPEGSNVLPAKESKRPAGAAAAPLVRRHETARGNESTLPPENRSNTTPAAREPFSIPLQGHKESAFDDFEMQDIHDPWLIDEIDTLPEEFEMDEGDWQGGVSLEELEHNDPFSETEAPRPPHVAFEAPLQLEREKVTHRVIPPAAKAAPEDLVASPPAPPVVKTERRTIAKKATPPKTKRSSPKRMAPVSPENALAENALEDRPTERPADPIGPSGTGSPAPAGVRPQPVQKNTNIVKVSSEGDCIELVRQIVKEHPHYGPTMIAKFFETRVDPPVRASRSTIYRWLRLAGLNTRDQRKGFADKPEETLAVEANPKDGLNGET
ncbi:MAG: STAS domain-containing protein [bacterium]